MVNQARWDRVFSTCSWILVAVLFYAAFAIFQFPTAVQGGPVTALVGFNAAEWFYGTLYGSTGLLLSYAKMFKKKKMRKHVLLTIYLVGIFTSLLTIGLVGWEWSRLWDNVTTAIIAAGCWLYWTFKTEYINPNFFYNDISELRDDLPPQP